VSEPRTPFPAPPAIELGGLDGRRGQVGVPGRTPSRWRPQAPRIFTRTRPTVSLHRANSDVVLGCGEEIDSKAAWLEA
jgi:hypothetical protein